MSIPREPRQQMINIMYLVLIAMLALSVSSEILNAFKIVNEGISNSNEALKGTIQATITGMEEKVAKENTKKNKAYLEAARNANQVTNEFISYVEELDQLMLVESGFDPISGEPNNPEDQDTPSRILLSDEQKGKAYELQQKIIETRTKYLDLFGEFPAKEAAKDTSFLLSAMPLRMPETAEDMDKDWANYNFYEMPILAVTTLLNQFKNDAHATEQMVVQRLSQKIGGVTPVFDFNTMQAIIVPSSKKVVEGDIFTAEIYVASLDNDQRPSIMIGGQQLPVDANGKAVFQTVASGVGYKDVNGSLMVKNAKGKNKKLRFSASYEVVPKPKENEMTPPPPPPPPPNRPTADPLELERVKKDNQRLIEQLEALAQKHPEQQKMLNQMKDTRILEQQIAELKQKNQEIQKQLQQQKQIEQKPPPVQTPQPKYVPPAKEYYGTVSADKMNVFYIGVANPITTAVFGASPEGLDVVCENCKAMEYGKSQYTAWVKGPVGSKAKVHMDVGGKRIGSKEFRIKRIPPPEVTLANKPAGASLQTGVAKAQIGLSAILKNFPFDAKYNILGYDLIISQRGQDLLVSRNSGAKFNDKSQQILNKLKVGDMIYIDNIKVKGPDKLTRDIPSIHYKIR